MTETGKGCSKGQGVATGGKTSAAHHDVIEALNKGEREEKEPLDVDVASRVLGVGVEPTKKPAPLIVLNGDDFPTPAIPAGLKQWVQNGRYGRYEYDREATMEIICRMLANGKSLISICKLKGVPDYSTVMDWIDEDPDLNERYTRARGRQTDYLAEENIEIADNCREGTKITTKKGGTEIATGDMVERSRLQIQARQWYASKLNPKKYGDRLQTDLAVTVETHEQRLQRLTGGKGDKE